MAIVDLLPQVVAHRGLSSLAPENTYAAIELAGKKGATWIEIDVNISADGIPYLHHDDKLNRCTNGNGYLVRTDSTILDKLDAGSWFSKDFRGEPLMRFEKLFELIEKYNLGVNIEIKPSVGWELPATKVICNYIKSSWPSNAPVLISSFSKLALLHARKLLPDHDMGLLVVAIPHDWKILMDQMDCQTFHCAWEFLNEENVQAIREEGYPILAYTVDDVKDAKSLVDLNVNSLFSNRPMQLLEELITLNEA